MRYIQQFQHVVDIQRKVIYFLLSLILAFGLTYALYTPELDQAQVYVMFLLFLSIGLWVTEAVPPFAVGLLIFGFLVFALGKYYAEIDPDSLTFLAAAENAMLGLTEWIERYADFLSEEAGRASDSSRADDLRESCPSPAGYLSRSDATHLVLPTGDTYRGPWVLEHPRPARPVAASVLHRGQTRRQTRRR